MKSENQAYENPVSHKLSAFLVHILVALLVMLTMLGFVSLMGFVRTQLGLEGALDQVLRYGEYLLVAGNALLFVSFAVRAIINLLRTLGGAADWSDRS